MARAALGKADHIFDAFYYETTRQAAWAWQSASRSSNRMAAGSGPTALLIFGAYINSIPKHTAQLTADSGCGRRAINRDVGLSLLTEGDWAEQESQRRVFYVLQANNSEPLRASNPYN
jgi:hypothetical protein